MMTSRPRFHSFGRMSLGRQASPAPEPAAKASAKHLGLKTTLDFSHTSRWYEACCTRKDWTEQRKYGSLVIAKMYKEVTSCSIFNHHIQCFCFWCNRVCVMCCFGADWLGSVYCNRALQTFHEWFQKVAKFTLHLHQTPSILHYIHNFYKIDYEKSWLYDSMSVRSPAKRGSDRSERSRPSSRSKKSSLKSSLDSKPGLQPCPVDIFFSILCDNGSSMSRDRQRTSALPLPTETFAFGVSMCFFVTPGGWRVMW